MEVMKVTFVSCMPRPISEQMPHINPSRYELPAAADRDFEVLVINDAIDNVYAGEGKHIARIESGESVAENMRLMICNSQLALGENAAPGVFWVAGELTKAEVKVRCVAELQRARLQQLNWYRNLVREADDVWAKFHQHRTISDLQRFAAQCLSVKREWTISIEEAESALCPACGSNLPNPNVTICATCKTIINKIEHEKKFGNQLVSK